MNLSPQLPSSHRTTSEAEVSLLRGSSPRRQGGRHTSEASTNALKELQKDIVTFIERPQSSTVATVFQVVIVITILVSVSAVILETVPGFSAYASTFFWLEVVATFIFTCELILRFLASPTTATFFLNCFNVVDIISVLPGYVQLLLPPGPYNRRTESAIMSLRVLRLMWLVRILRLAKVARHSNMLSAVISMLSKALFSSILLIFGLLAFLTVVSASLLYMVESDRCEQIGVVCEGFNSIPTAFWFSVQTLTCTGYGDVIPVTLAGKILAGFFSVCGVILLALTGALFCYDFEEHFREEKWNRKTPRPLNGKHDKELDELEDLVNEFRSTWESLAARLDNIAVMKRDSQEASQAESVMMLPMLRLIQDRGRSVCSEVQGFVGIFGVAEVHS